VERVQRRLERDARNSVQGQVRQPVPRKSAARGRTQDAHPRTQGLGRLHHAPPTGTFPFYVHTIVCINTQK